MNPQRVCINGFWYWKTTGGYKSAIKIKDKLWYAKDCEFYPEQEFVEPDDNEFMLLMFKRR